MVYLLVRLHASKCLRLDGIVCPEQVAILVFRVIAKLPFEQFLPDESYDRVLCICKELSSESAGNKKKTRPSFNTGDVYDELVRFALSNCLLDRLFLRWLFCLRLLRLGTLSGWLLGMFIRAFLTVIVFIFTLIILIV